ncbi:hypothetical protein CCP3SC1AL1_2120009 [Gammaproteobacteria bacterium]
MTEVLTNRQKALALRLEGIPVADIAKRLGLSRVTVYKYSDSEKKVVVKNTKETKEEGGTLLFRYNLLLLEVEFLNRQILLYKKELTKELDYDRRTIESHTVPGSN